MTTIRVMHAVDYLALSQPWYSDPMDMQQRHCLWCDDAFWTDAAQPQAACCDHCVDMLMEHSDEIPPQDWAAAFTDYLNTHEVVDKDSDTVYYQNHKVY